MKIKTERVNVLSILEGNKIIINTLFIIEVAFAAYLRNMPYITVNFGSC